MRHGTPLAPRGVPGETGHLSSGIWNLGVFSRRCTGESLPLCVDFIHRVEFEEVSGHRVLIKRGPGNRGPSECGTTHEATSGMCRETGLILRCDRRSGNPSRQSRGVDPPVQIRRVEGAQRKWCRKTSVFLSRETGMSGHFVGRIKGAKYRFDLQYLTWDFS